ncbi:MAG TPA: hypothetical protein VM285_07785, partial [Polyangia bacterium]|nr:hypothetical protein [Polyangia bacterium]
RPAAGQTVNNAPFLWDTEDFDTDAFHSTVTNTGRMTIPAGLGGKYMLTASVTPNSASAQAFFRRNAAAITAGADTGAWTYCVAGQGSTISTVMDLADADYVEVFSPDNVTWYGSDTLPTEFSIVRLG